MGKGKKHFVNGQPLTSKNEQKLNSPNNCELAYSFAYYNDSKRIYAYYAVGNDALMKEDQVKGRFAYTILSSVLYYSY